MRFFVFILISSLLIACRSTRPIQAAVAKKDTATVVTVNTARQDSINFIKNTVQQISNNRIAFQTFSGKVNVDYSGADGKKYDVNASVRMYKDSAIWISANALLGIEAIRVLVTKDSVKMLDKLNKTYVARSVDYLQEVTSLPLNLYILQDLLIGNPVFLDSNIVSYTRSGDAIALLSIGKWFKNLVSVGESDKLLQRSKLDDVDITRSRTADLTYAGYESKKGKPFSTKRSITVSEKKKLDIKLDFKQIDFNEEVSFPFSIPKNFTRNQNL